MASADASAQMAILLGIPLAAFRDVAGKSWFAAETDRPEWDELEGQAAGRPVSSLFVGRPGPSVALAIAEGLVIVGPAAGTWVGVGFLRWHVGTPSAAISTPRTAGEQPAFLSDLGQAVEAAAAAKAPSLVRCQYCRRLVAPEHAFDARTCHGCASSVLGVVY